MDVSLLSFNRNASLLLDGACWSFEPLLDGSLVTMFFSHFRIEAHQSTSTFE